MHAIILVFSVSVPVRIPRNAASCSEHGFKPKTTYQRKCNFAHAQTTFGALVDELRGILGLSSKGGAPTTSDSQKAKKLREARKAKQIASFFNGVLTNRGLALEGVIKYMKGCCC